MNDSKKMHKRTLSPHDVEQLLGIVDIHPLKSDGKVLCFAGQRPSVYAWAKVESAEVKVEDDGRNRSAGANGRNSRWFRSSADLDEKDFKGIWTEDR